MPPWVQILILAINFINSSHIIAIHLRSQVLVVPRIYLASDFMALLEELDDEIGQQLAEM